MTDIDIRTITITAAPAPTITLTTSGFKVKGVRNVDLGGGRTMDVHLDSGIVATTPNDGRPHLRHRWKGGRFIHLQGLPDRHDGLLHIRTA